MTTKQIIGLIVIIIIALFVINLAWGIINLVTFGHPFMVLIACVLIWYFFFRKK